MALDVARGMQVGGWAAVWVQQLAAGWCMLLHANSALPFLSLQSLAAAIVRLLPQPHALLMRRRSCCTTSASALPTCIVQALEESSPSIMHRDLKPSNVFIDAAGAARVADMGLARVLTPAAMVSLTGETGTYGEYCAAAGARSVGCKKWATESFRAACACGRLFEQCDILVGPSLCERTELSASQVTGLSIEWSA